MLVLIQPADLIIDVHKMGPEGHIAKGFVINGGWWYSEEGDKEYCYYDRELQQLVNSHPAVRNQICIIPSWYRYKDYNELSHTYGRYKMDRMRVLERFLMADTHNRPFYKRTQQEDDYDDDIPF